MFVTGTRIFAAGWLRDRTPTFLLRHEANDEWNADHRGSPHVETTVRNCQFRKPQGF
jgi:hypothetical protein